MKAWLALLVIPAAACLTLHSQVAPAGTGVATNFGYVLRYAQTAHFGGDLGNWQTATPSGEVHFRNGHRKSPFSLNYAGGYTWTLNGPTEYSTGFFQRLYLLQAMSGEKWKASIIDDVSYRPTAPITGFSGIAGTGEPIGTPSPPPNQSILTVGTHALDNLAAGELTRTLSPKYSISVGANYGLLFFPDGDGLNTYHLSADTELARSISRLTSVFGSYIFTRFSYPDVHLTTDANVVIGGYEHAFTRRLHIDLSAGPGWITSSESKVVPDSIMLTAHVGLDYRMATGSGFVRYDRSASGGSGYLIGQLSDIVDGGYSRIFARTFTAEVVGGYRRIQPLGKSAVIHGEMGTIQGSWRFADHLSAFANYTVIAQSSAGPLPSNAVTAPLQTISFGIAYAMRARRNF